MRSLGWALIQLGWCPYKKRTSGPRHRERRPREHTQRRWPPTSQGERLQKKEICWHSDLRLPASWTEQGNFYCWRHPACGALLRRSQQIHGRTAPGANSKENEIQTPGVWPPSQENRQTWMDVVKILPALNQRLGCRPHPHLTLTQAPGSFFDQASWPAPPSPPALALHLPASLFLGAILQPLRGSRAIQRRRKDGTK